MRFLHLCLLCIVMCTLQAACRAADLMLPVPTTDPVYADLRQLDTWKLISDGQENLLNSKTQRVLTRYDIAFLLVEPLERCAALIDVQEGPVTRPEQRRRAEIAYLTVSKLTPTECDQMLRILTHLLRVFSADIDQLSPALSRRATPALHKLQQAEYRPWIKGKTSFSETTPVIRLSINPHATPDSLSADPLLFLAPKGGRTSLFLRPNTTGSGETELVGTRPMSSLEAAVDIAYGRFRLYGSLSTLPGQDPAQMIMNPDGSGKAMLGLEVGMAHVRDLGISGIFEFHIQRSGEPDNMDINTGVKGGIGLNW